MPPFKRMPPEYYAGSCEAIIEHVLIGAVVVVLLCLLLAP